MNKTISINPDIFSFSSTKRKSRKNNPKEKQQDIKIKPHKEKTKQVRKQHILRFLRQKQDDNYKKLIEGETPKPKITSFDEPFNSDFDESLKFLKDVTATNDNKHNFTSKNRNNTSIAPLSSILTPIDINTDNLDTNTMSIAKPSILNASTPSWGCLKNGSLPTFRDWKQSTQKSHSLGINDNKREISAMMKMKTTLEQPTLKCKKQRKTVRRTYKVGKSSIISKVSVLISNKTIRNNIMDKTQTIKMHPIAEMKRFLIKKGFIRVGTSAPNDIIVKMYETANLVCGEIENHNADNLLFNYMNDIE